MRRLVAGFLIFCFSIYTFAAEQKLEKLTIVLDNKLNPDHAPLIVAAQQGFFKDQELDVTFVTADKTNTVTKLISSKKADIGITHQPDLMREVEQGNPLVQVGTLIDRPLDCIIALHNKHIYKLADLRGKRIGVQKHKFNAVTLNAMLKNAGLTKKDVEIVVLEKDPNKALIQGKVDAIAGMMRNTDVPKLERRGKDVDIFLPEENGIPNYSVLVFITNKEKTEDSRLPRFLSAVKEGVAYLDEHPEQSWRLFAKQHPYANNKINRDMWFATLPYFAEEPGMFDMSEWKTFAEFMKRNQMIKMARPVSHYAVNIG